MENERQDLSERLLEFGASIIRFVAKLEKTTVGKHVSNQLMRSGTSSGANYEEACGAESRADFIHKLQLALKELRESLYWLKLTKKSELLPQEHVLPLINETDELVKIIAKSVVTARQNNK